MEWQKLIDKIVRMIVTLLVSIGFISGPSTSPKQVAQTTPSPSIPSQTATLPTSPTPKTPPTHTPIPSTTTFTPILGPQSLRPERGSVCGYDPQVNALISDFELSGWAHWIELLSGEKPVQMNGEIYTILTRYNEPMFSGDPGAGAYEFVLDQLRQWGYQDGNNLFEQEYRPKIREPKSNWKNIVVLIPGNDPELAQEQVLLTAHLDSTSQGKPDVRAPGADDNGSGVATLLEAARVFRNMEFRRTIKIVFFSGEEQGLNGSRAYVNRYQHELDDIVGVFNLDMFGYDSDNDRCFEIHVGWMTESNLVGGCLADIIEIYGFALKFDYIITDAISASDHATFWNAGVGAIEVLENFRTDELTGGCSESDINPHYHTERDLIEMMNLDTGHTIANAAIAAVARLAEPIPE